MIPTLCMTTGPSATPWQQPQQQGSGTTQDGGIPLLLVSLRQAKLKAQIVLRGMGVTDPLEQEFGEVVKPLMESCTKEAIAVSDE